jgi:hypothetical protein
MEYGVTGKCGALAGLAFLDTDRRSRHNGAGPVHGAPLGLPPASVTISSNDWKKPVRTNKSEYRD